MSQKLNDAVQKVVNEQKVMRAIQICELDLFETIELDNLDETYKELDVEVQYGKFSVYEKDGNIVFIKSVNEENGFGKVILVPEEMSDEVYKTLTEKTRAKENFIPNLLNTLGIVCFLFIAIFEIVFLVDLFQKGFDLLTFLQTNIWICFPGLLLSGISMGIAKRIKNL